MKNIFNNQIVRMVRDEVNDLRKKDKDTRPNEERSSIPTYYHHPSSTSSTTDSYSHTANSTAGYSQRNAYPTLINSQEREKQVFEENILFSYLLIFILNSLEFSWKN
jgi:hypothetical protein